MDAKNAAKPAVFRPAYQCDAAVLTLRWGRLRSVIYGWDLRDRGQRVATIDGYPVYDGPITEERARAWADGIVGPQDWIVKPPRSGAMHTHATPGTPCPTSAKD